LNKETGLKSPNSQKVLSYNVALSDRFIIECHIFSRWLTLSVGQVALSVGDHYRYGSILALGRLAVACWCSFLRDKCQMPLIVCFHV